MLALDGHPARARAGRRLGIAAILSLVTAGAALIQGPGWNQNSHYALIRALADHTPKIDQTQHETGTMVTGDISKYGGHVYSNKAPGFAFAVLPAYLLMQAARKAEPVSLVSGQLWFLGLWGVVLPTAVLLLLVQRVASGLEPGFGTAAAVTLGLGTLILPFSSLFFSHIFSALLGFGAFVLLWLERRGPPRIALVGAAGLLAGYAVTTELPNVIMATIVGTYALTRTPRLRRGFAYAAGALAGVVPLLLYNRWAFGSPLHLSYSSTVGFGRTGSFFLSRPSFRRVVEVLFAPAGIIRATPVIAMAFLGIVFLYRRHRLDALLVAAVALAYLLFESSYTTPFGGSSPGPRQLIPILPFLALPLASSYRRLPATTLVLAVVSAVEMIAATFTHPLQYIDGAAGWFHQVGLGHLSATVLGLFGPPPVSVSLLPYSPHWYFLVVFFVPILVAVAFAVAGRPTIGWSVQDAVRAVACLFGWLVVQREGPKFLAQKGVGAPLTVLLLVAAVVVAVAALPRALGAGAGTASPRNDGSGGENV